MHCEPIIAPDVARRELGPTVPLSLAARPLRPAPPARRDAEDDAFNCSPIQNAASALDVGPLAGP